MLMVSPGGGGAPPPQPFSEQENSNGVHFAFLPVPFRNPSPASLALGQKTLENTPAMSSLCQEEAHGWLLGCHLGKTKSIYLGCEESEES